VQISTAALLATIDTSSEGYGGSGTVAVAPSLTEALAMGDATNCWSSTLLLGRTR